MNPMHHEADRSADLHRLALFHTDQLTLLLKSKTFLALFRNSVIGWRRRLSLLWDCILSNSAIAWSSCRLIMASYLNNRSSSSFSGKKKMIRYGIDLRIAQPPP
jgi:hypothetical protein